MKLIEAQKSEKKPHLDRLLEHGIVMIFVDGRRVGVDVPQEHRETSQLPLNISYTYQIPDFKVTEERIEITLTFQSGLHFCVIPLDAVYAFNSQLVGESIVFPEDVPQDLFHPTVVSNPDPASNHVPEKKKNTGHLKLVK